MADGPSNQQPINPDLVNLVERFNKGLELMNEKAASSEELLRSMAEHTGAIAADTDKTVRKLRDYVKASDDLVENHKMIMDYAKKRLDANRKDLQDAQKAKKEMQALADLYEEALKSAKSQTKETKHWEDSLKRLKKDMEGIGSAATLTEEQVKKMGERFKEASKDAKAIQKSISDMGRHATMFKGALGMMGTLGVPGARGMNTRIENRLQQQQELKEKLTEHIAARKKATRTHMDKKREKAGADVEAMGVGYVDAGGFTEKGFKALAKGMGYKSGSKKSDAFITGEKANAREQAGGAAATAGEKAGWVGAMEEGGGAMEMVSSVIEKGIASLTALAPEIIIPLEILAAVIGTLTETYATQNKEMEKKFGAGGLFTQPGVGAGQAFAQARWAMNPIQAGTVPLGMTMERNMALAGGMVGGGFNVAQDFGDNAPNTANAAHYGTQGSFGAPGPETAFMKGGLGEAQAIVMGVSRVSGLDDTQGTENLIKLLNQYKETMASSEKFMTRLNVDTHAAGISTTKYLQIIDQVSGAFDHMGKSLEQVTGVMKELTRYGAISSESLKDMMEFLASGQQKTSMSNVQNAAYLESVKTPQMLESERATQKSTLKTYASNFNDQATRMGMPNVALDKAIDSGDFDQISSTIGMMRSKVTDMPEGPDKQTMMGTIAQMQAQLGVVQGVMSNDPLKRAMARANQPENQAATQANLFTNLTEASKQSGLTLSQLSKNQGSATQLGIANGVFEMLGGKEKAFANLESLRTEATSRIKDVRDEADPTKQKAGYKQLFTEIDAGTKRKGGWRVQLTNMGYEKYLGKTMDETLDNMMKTKEGIADANDFLSKNNDAIMDSGETMGNLESAAGITAKTTQKQLIENIDNARSIGIRTQTVEDLLKNIFQPLLAGLVSSVEEIARGVAWLASDDDGGPAADNAQKQLSVLPEAIDELTKTTQDTKNGLTEWTKKAGDPTKFTDEQKKYYADQMKSIDDANKQITMMQGVASRGAFVDDEAAQVGKIIQNHVTYFSSDITQQFATNDSVTNSGEGAKSPMPGMVPAPKKKG